MDKNNLIVVIYEIIRSYPFMQYFGISVLYGMVSWIQKVRNNPLKKNFFDFSCEIVMSIAGGFLASKICEALNFSSAWTIITVCIASFSGIKFIEYMNFIIMQKIAKETGVDAEKVNEHINKVNEKEVITEEDMLKAKD